MKKIMISQPISTKTDEEIATSRNKAITFAKDNGYEFISTLFTDEWYNPEKIKERGVENIPVFFLAKSIEHMSLCNTAYFCSGWEVARGCKIEHEIAKAYGLEIIYEEDSL